MKTPREMIGKLDGLAGDALMLQELFDHHGLDTWQKKWESSLEDLGTAREKLQEMDTLLSDEGVKPEYRKNRLGVLLNIAGRRIEQSLNNSAEIVQGLKEAHFSDGELIMDDDEPEEKYLHEDDRPPEPMDISSVARGVVGELQDFNKGFKKMRQGLEQTFDIRSNRGQSA